MLSRNSRERLRVQAMAGFQKIKRTCQIALSEEISYFMKQISKACSAISSTKNSKARSSLILCLNDS
ncbi:hypothetical protein IQ07DRAFT_236870 [Pyrenochaeta sp. DS3sAY3a]|nr:hypothetical protein IQ07DRAFT_236870 [Pyrenochaeta sp. DS3sAY3a]